LSSIITHERWGSRIGLILAMRERRAEGYGLLALTVGLGGWWLQRDATPALAASAPLERLLVLPLEHEGDPDLAPQVTALGDHLRDALTMDPGIAVVDTERTMQALRQLDPAGAAQPNISGLHSVAAAQRILQPALVLRDGRWQVQAQLHGPGGEVLGEQTDGRRAI